MKGQIYKAGTNSYTVKCGFESYQCTARGVLKLSTQLCVGDFVEFEGGVITGVLPRKNRFLRPNVSNVDMVLAVISPVPKPDLFLLDKIIINATYQGIKTVIAVNKRDIDDKLFDDIKEQYKDCGADIMAFSAYSHEGGEQLKSALGGKLTVLAGQSAAGKSSIVGALLGITVKTGELSEKIIRGKHTTTSSEIYEKDGFRLIDTPGFAAIEADVPAEDLPYCYAEYLSAADKCRFRGCTHISEPDCMVKNMVEEGKLSLERYERYKEIYTRLSERRDYERN